MIFGSQCMAMLVKEPMRSVPQMRPLMALTVWPRLSFHFAISRRKGRTRSPSVVRLTPSRPRMKMRKPNSSSTPFIMWLTPDCV